MKRPGIISFDLLFGQPDVLKHYLLAYDELWIPWLSKSFPSAEDIDEWDLDREHLASLEWLAGERFLIEPPFDIELAESDQVMRGLASQIASAEKEQEKTYDTAESAALGAAAASFNYDMALTRLTAYVAWRDHQALAYPVVFPFIEQESAPPGLSESHSVLSVVLKRFPAPSETVPLQDLLTFKRDPDTQLQFGRLWHWIRKLSAAGTSQHEIEEELDTLLLEYSAHLRQLTKQVSHDRIESVISAPGDVLEDLVKLRWGSLTRRVLQVRKIDIAASGAEMKLPGSEVAYITEASRALVGRR